MIVKAEALLSSLSITAMALEYTSIYSVHYHLPEAPFVIICTYHYIRVLLEGIRC